MNMQVGGLIVCVDDARERELALSTMRRHKEFRRKIAEKAEALARSKMESAVVEMVAAPQKSDCWFGPVDCLRGLPTVETIQKAVCKYYGVSRMDLLSARRTWDVMRPRQIGYYLSKELALRSLPDIGRRFGGRDHTSALWGIKKIKRLLLKDAELAQDVACLIEKITGTQQ